MFSRGDSQKNLRFASVTGEGCRTQTTYLIWIICNKKRPAVRSTHSALLWRYRSIWRSFHLHGGISPPHRTYRSERSIPCEHRDPKKNTEMTFKPWVILVGGSKWSRDPENPVAYEIIPEIEFSVCDLVEPSPEKIHPTNRNRNQPFHITAIQCDMTQRVFGASSAMSMFPTKTRKDLDNLITFITLWLMLTNFEVQLLVHKFMVNVHVFLTLTFNNLMSLQPKNLTCFMNVPSKILAKNPGRKTILSKVFDYIIQHTPTLLQTTTSALFVHPFLSGWETTTLV